MNSELLLELGELAGMGMIGASSLVEVAEHLAEQYDVQAEAELPIAVSVDANALMMRVINGTVDDAQALEEIKAIVQRALLVRDDEESVAPAENLPIT